MRWYRRRPSLWGVVFVTAGLVSLTGCSHSGHSGKAPSSAVAHPIPSSAAATALPPGVVDVSPTGVTTRVDAPADSTEEEYFQACHAAKLWMDAQPATGQSLIEPYLAMVQAAQSGAAGSWNIRWADLTLARQAAVIIAVRAAAAAECG